MIIIDETLQEEDSDTTRKEGQGKGTDGTKIGGEMGHWRLDYGNGNGGSILVHIGTNNTDKEGTTAIVETYRNLLKKTSEEDQ